MLILFRVVSVKDSFTSKDIQLRTYCFIKEAEKLGIRFKALKGPFGYLSQFKMEIGGKSFWFEGLPRAEFLNKPDGFNIDDKSFVKRKLAAGNFPVAKGRSFWFFQKKRAIRWAVNEPGFPVVVKPRAGSYCQGVTANIRNENKLKYAIEKAIAHSPSFIIEKFIPDSFVYRATVVDFDFVAVVKQIPANVIGDGVSSISKLIGKKNRDPHRGLPHQKGFILFKLVVNETTNELLRERSYNLSTVLDKGEVFYLQKDPFAELGGDLEEVTLKVHPDNIKLFQDVAKLFGVRLVGIDFIARDISVSFKSQQCAVLELNSIPCIEMHQFPFEGEPQNIAGALAKMVLKYYR